MNLIEQLQEMATCLPNDMSTILNAMQACGGPVSGMNPDQTPHLIDNLRMLRNKYKGISEALSSSTLQASYLLHTNVIQLAINEIMPDQHQILYDLKEYHHKHRTEHKDNINRLNTVLHLLQEDGTNPHDVTHMMTKVLDSEATPAEHRQMIGQFIDRLNG